jgi:DNA-directed RNA polymerase specialized sigma24 family protein
MTSASGDDALPLDEAGFGRVLDRISPGLLALGRCFATDDATAERLVEGAWRSALRGELPGTRLPVALARRMAVAAADDPPALASARQRLRLALATGGSTGLPGQRDRRQAAGPGGSAPLAREIAVLPPALRVALVLHDVHGWPAQDVQALLGVSHGVFARLLGQARARLVPHAVGEAV